MKTGTMPRKSDILKTDGNDQDTVHNKRPRILISLWVKEHA